MPTRLSSQFLRFSLLTAPPAAILLAACGSTSGNASTSVAAPSLEPGPGGAPYAVIDGEVAPVPDIPMGDPATIAAILEEGKNRNQVMDHLVHLCGEIGPRLTASSALEEANMWSAARFEAWGLQNVENQVWNTATLRFDRGPYAISRRENRVITRFFNEIINWFRLE